MKYLPQLCIILGFTLLGEALQRLIPLPIPASVYGLALLFLALMSGIVKLEQVRDTGLFLTGILPVLFVAPTVGIVQYWDVISSNLLSLLLLILGSTALTFGVSGSLTQALVKKGGDSHD